MRETLPVEARMGLIVVPRSEWQALLAAVAKLTTDVEQIGSPGIAERRV